MIYYYCLISCRLSFNLLQSNNYETILLCYSSKLKLNSCIKRKQQWALLRFFVSSLNYDEALVFGGKLRNLLACGSEIINVYLLKPVLYHTLTLHWQWSCSSLHVVLDGGPCGWSSPLWSRNFIPSPLLFGISKYQRFWRSILDPPRT